MSFLLAAARMGVGGWDVYFSRLVWSNMGLFRVMLGRSEQYYCVGMCLSLDGGWGPTRKTPTPQQYFHIHVDVNVHNYM